MVHVHQSSSPSGSNQPPLVRQSLSIQPAEDGDDGAQMDSSSVSSSGSSSYHDASSNDLTLVAGALLLTADCMGTGILALPADMHKLGKAWGIAFLVFNLPVNLYAGTILSRCALYVEERILGHGVANRSIKIRQEETEMAQVNSSIDHEGIADDKIERKTQQRRGRMKGYSSVDENENPSERAKKSSNEKEWSQEDHDDILDHKHQQHTDTATFDFVGMTSMLFDEPILPDDSFVADAFDADTLSEDDGDGDINATSARHRHHRQITYKHPFTKVVLAIYYINIFLVLGNYILVMSHAVSAMVGEDKLCIPTAGIIASTLMFALSQIRTMANLGRSISVASLLALLIVVIQCLYSLQGADKDGSNEIMEEEEEEYEALTSGEVALARMSSLAAIHFAVGSQKLLLNIRHEMADRTKAAPGSLSIALSLYGLAYIIVCLLAGQEPPSFLFDAIPPGYGRRVAGFLLWLHVAVSYAINSQALCSSVDRVVGHRIKFCGMEKRHEMRWLVLTSSVAVSSYLIANAVPFFKDLVALCGALTSVPLSLLIPAIFYRRLQKVPLCFPTINSTYSFSLLWYGICFMIIGLIGALGSIDVDWKSRSQPFACH